MEPASSRQNPASCGISFGPAAGNVPAFRANEPLSPRLPTTNPPIHQSTNPSIHQSTNPPIHQSTNPPIHQSTNPPIHQSTNPPIHQSTNPPIYQSTSLPTPVKGVWNSLG